MKTGYYFKQEAYGNDMNGFLAYLDSIESELPVSCSLATNEPAVVSIGSFLQGFCGNLARYFQDQYDLQVGVLSVKGEMLHIFNYADINGTRFYLDVRGLTDEWDAFVKPFQQKDGVFQTVLEHYGQNSLPEDVCPEDDISQAMLDWLFSKNESLRIKELAEWLSFPLFEFLHGNRTDSPFDFEEQKKKPPYEDIELMIDPEGVIVWALPSHQEFLIYKAMVRFGYSREVLMAACPPEFYYDFLRWLIPMSGGWIPVWKQGVMDYPVTKKQHAALKKLKLAGFFRGTLPQVQK